MIDEWRCDICGETRPDALISVFTRDISEDHGFPIGTMKHNIKYCNDKAECTEKAPTYQPFKK